jgi:serine/threonine-protein kinase RsbW
MDDTANVRLKLPSRPENVLVVRQALSGLAARLGLDAIETNDLNTAVTEACNNVVMHAYRGEEGPLEVQACVLPGALAVRVRDRGVGIDAGRRAREADRDDDGDRELPGGGMGLALIDALARRVELAEHPDGGTEVRMEFPAPDGVELDPVQADRRAAAGAGTPEHESTVEVSIAPVTLARAILPRVLCTLAARAHFTTDRISDVQIVADVLAANAGESLHGSHLAVGVSIAPRNLELRIGPLRAGRGESLMAAAADGLTPVIERLTDSQHVAPNDSGEMLELRLIDRR